MFSSGTTKKHGYFILTVRLHSSKIVMTSVVQVVMLLSGSVRLIRCFWPAQIILAGGTVFFFFLKRKWRCFFLAKCVSGTVFSDVPPPSGDFKRNVYFFISLPPRSARDRFAFCRWPWYIFLFILVFFNFTTKTDVDRGTITRHYARIKGLKRKISSA